MSKITQKPAVGVLNPWPQLPTSSNYTGTFTPATTAQAFSALPASGTQPSSGTGFFDANFVSYVGEKFETSDGRVLVIVQNGATAIGAGKLVQAPAQVTAFHALAITVPTAYPATAGSKEIYVTNGTTVLNVNQFQGGYATVASGTGAGQTFKIASNHSAAASTSFVLNLEDPIQTALDATSTITLNYNVYGGSYTGVVISSHLAVGLPVGITITPLAASTAATYNATTGALTANGTAQYGLIQTAGPTSVLIDTLTNVGYPVGPSTLVDGAVAVATLTASPQIGISAQTQVSAGYGLVFLQL